jgi:hypothetical protein
MRCRTGKNTPKKIDIYKDDMEEDDLHEMGES